METDTSLEVLTLMGLDFNIGCGHSAHTRDPRHHDQGEAKFVIKALHDCKNTGTTLYPGCQAWADHVNAMAEEAWVCPQCQYGDAGKNMCFVVGPLDPS